MSSGPGCASPRGWRRPSSTSFNQSPATTLDQPAVLAGKAPLPSPSTAAPANRRMPLRNEIPSPAVPCCTFFQCASTASSFSRSTSTQRPFSRIRPLPAPSNCSHSSLESVSPSSETETLKSIIASSPRPAARWPMFTWTWGRGGWRAFHQSGMRTTMPLASNIGMLRRN